MHTSRFARRRRQLGAVVAGLCVAAGSMGNIALASRSGSGNSGSGGSGSGSSTTISIEASVMVQAGMTPINARQAAANLNAAIDSAARTMAQAAVSVTAGRPVQTTAAATKAFATEADAALTDFVVSSVAGLKAAGVGTANLVNGTLAALSQVVRTIPGAVAVTTGAEISVAGGIDGASVSAALNPTVDAAMRQTISGSVREIRTVLRLSRPTLRTVGAGVRQIVDASVVATERIVRATVDLAAAVVSMTGTTLQAARAVADSAGAALNTVVAAVDATLDSLSDLNIAAEVDASLGLSVR